MATTNLNTHLWIRIYNGFAIILDLRQTGIAKNLATFGNKILWIFLCALLIYMQKELDFYLLWFFYNLSSNLQRNLNTLATRSRETRLFLPDAVGPRAVKRGSFTVLFCRAVFLSKRNENSRFLKNFYEFFCVPC